jgi:hypothetical protein
MPPKRKQKGRKVRLDESHAAARLVTRTNGELTFEELKRRISVGEFRYVRRQSVSRSLCSTPIDDTRVVYFILNRQTKSVVTVLDDDHIE